MDTIRTIEWRDDKVIMLDQRKLPAEEIYNTYEDYLSVAHAIKNMVVRGAPAIGVSAAYGLVVGLQNLGAEADLNSGIEELNKSCEYLASSRPTAVNLFWALDRVKRRAEFFVSSEKGADLSCPPPPACRGQDLKTLRP